MKKLLSLLISVLIYLPLESKELENCKWENKSGTPCLNIFSAPNTSKITEGTLGKTVITKKQMIDSGYQDVRSVLEYVAGIDVYSDGPTGQKTSIFMRGTNSNHTLVLMNGIPINDIGSPKAMFDFGYDFLEGLQQIEIYKGASGAIFGPAAIGGAINFVTAINYENSASFSIANKRNNSINGNYTYITDNGWHHNIKGGSTQVEEISAGNSQPDLDGTKNLSLSYNTKKFLSDNLKFKGTGYLRKTDTGYDHFSDEKSEGTNIMYALQSSLENKTGKKLDTFTSHIHVYDRVYDQAEKNKYYSKAYTLKAERKINFSDNLSYGFGSDYKYDKGDFQVYGTFGNSAKGHSDNLGIFSNAGYKMDDTTTLSLHTRGDTHKYSGENITYRLNATKQIDKLTLSLSEATGVRQPDLYVLHGGNPGSSFYNGAFTPMLTTKPETSLTREISAKYNLSDSISFESTAYRGSVSDVLNRSNSSGGYNETLDIEQEGLESSFTFKNDNQRISLTNTLSKSSEGNGKPQLRRPEKQYGVSYNAKLNSSYTGLFGMNVNYRHVGKTEDWVGSFRKKVDSTDIINLSLTKELFGMEWAASSTNLTNEYYQRPYGFNQEGRNFKLSLRSKY
jgi:vitamin B12 transporter